MQLNKPMKLYDLNRTIQRLLSKSSASEHAHHARPVEQSPRQGTPVIHIVDDDDRLREALRSVLEDDGRTVEDYATCEMHFSRPTVQPAMPVF